MKALFVCLALLVLVAPTTAQVFAPVTIDQYAYMHLYDMISGLEGPKFKNVLPIIQFLEQLENEAQQARRRVPVSPSTQSPSTQPPQ